MPNFDHKGPEGLGPKTGMKQGTCIKVNAEDYMLPERKSFRKGRRQKNNKIKITKLNS